MYFVNNYILGLCTLSQLNPGARRWKMKSTSGMYSFGFESGGGGIKFLFNAILFNNFYILPKVGGDGVDNVDVGEFDLRFFENLFKENDRDFRLLEIHVYYS